MCTVLIAAPMKVCVEKKSKAERKIDYIKEKKCKKAGDWTGVRSRKGKGKMTVNLMKDCK